LIWISGNTGLTVREESDMDAGNQDKSQTSVRMVYQSVQAPAGVR
jgi:hypothetical protein